ncbi:MAG: GNAT family N-acetyltransferase [Thermoplasmata archaeon]
MRADADDLDRVTPLFDAYRRFYGRRSSRSSVRRFLARRLERQDSAIFYAERGSHVVGFAQLYPSFTSLSMAPAWILNDLYVLPSERRTGVGTALLRESLLLAQRTRARELTLETGRDNPARHLYEAMGWVVDESFLHYRRRVLRSRAREG